MTVSYSGNVCRLLVRWKGSIWRSVWRELVIFIILYYCVRFFYTDFIPILDPNGDLQYKQMFASICRQFNEYTKLIPLTFLLGFYVSNVVSRWWRQFECLCWPEDMLSMLCFVVPGSDTKSAKIRHRIARYLNLTCALAWRDISSKIRLRFPTVRHIVDCGLLTETEYKLLEEISELKSFRVSFRRLFCHDWVCVPLVYTQVAALATYAFFFFCLFGRQFIEDTKKDVDMKFPLFTVVQFLFFVGWFKVGQDLMRPFGLDDDDIELSYILDRNIVTSFTIVDNLQMRDPPKFEEDPFWKCRNMEEHKESTLKFGRIDLSRNAHKHPPKRHTYMELKDKEDELELETGACGCKVDEKFLVW